MSGKIGFTMLVAGPLLSVGCANSESVVSPANSLSRVRVATAPSSYGATTFTVQGFTSREGQILSYTPSNCYRDSVWVFQAPDPDRYIKFDKYCDASDPPVPYNGGWINVYAVKTSGDVYLGQVYGNLTSVIFDYDGPLVDVRLDAFPDNIQQCQFLYFDNYPPGQNSITLTGQGQMPLAQFYCP